MTRTTIALAALALCLLAAPAEAKYRIPTAPELLGRSSLIVVGEVEAVGERSYTVKVCEQLVGPEKALRGSIEVWARQRGRRICAPSDPAGITPGTRWVWILEPSAKAYRSWISAPLRIERSAGEAGVTIERVRYGRIQPKATAEAPTLAAFKALIQGYRACYQIAADGSAKQRASAEDLARFLASSPYAAELVRRTPRVQSLRGK